MEKRETRKRIFSTLNRRDPSHILTSNSDRKETGIIRENIQSQACYLKDKYWDFPVSPMVKSLCFQCRGYGFIPRAGELRSHMPWGMAKLKDKYWRIPESYKGTHILCYRRRQWQPTPVLLPGKSHGRRSLVGCSPWGRWRLGTTERLHFHALEKAMATHSSVLAWRIPGTGEPGGLPSMGSHRVRHDWSDLAAAASCAISLRFV